jgi:hypothetical protein
MVRPLDESQGSSPLQGHGPWHECEVALSMGIFTRLANKQDGFDAIWRRTVVRSAIGVLEDH